jgi:hypothetical protein
MSPRPSSQYPCYTSDDPADRAADDGAHWTCGAFPFAGTFLNAAGHALGWRRKWCEYGCGKKCRSDNLTDHLETPI